MNIKLGRKRQHSMNCMLLSKPLMAIDFVQLAALSSVCNAGPVVWERLSRLPDVDDSFRENFHARIVESGFHFRESVQDQTMVIRAFRDLLPPYSGPSQKLYRGEIASKHERRDYGFSWTPLLRVAQRLFVERRQILNGEPGILLETIAPPEAIIAAPHPHSIYIGEYEYIVDPAALQEIRVIE